MGLGAPGLFQLASATAPLNFAPGFEACARNCGQISQVGNSLVVTLLDRNGKPFKVASIDIDPTASRVTIGTRNDAMMPMATGLGSGAGSGDISAQSIQTYVYTATQTVIYTMTYYYQGGVLVDVKVTEQRFPKERIK